MSEWQPIDTAPLEGDAILVTRYVRSTNTGSIWVYHVAWWHRDGGWYTLGGGPLTTPTHWMPLPEPPP